MSPLSNCIMPIFIIVAIMAITITIIIIKPIAPENQVVNCLLTWINANSPGWSSIESELGTELVYSPCSKSNSMHCLAQKLGIGDKGGTN